MVTENFDIQLWDSVRQEDKHAFEQVVSRHQAAVSAVSFSCIGDFAASEDISQETFLVAWQARDSLQNASRLRAWLCGIARNLAKNYVRRAVKQRERSADHALESQAAETQVASQVETRAMESEEQELVWNTLESISETYREPLVLFYREGQSVSAIADALDISEDAAKQRLKRGRGMLRDAVANLVGDTLEQTRPGRKFTAAVMASIGTATVSSNALASTTSVATAASSAAKLASASKVVGATGLGSGGMIGLLGGIGGAAAGLGGAWLGTWLPAQLAESMEEKQIVEESGKRAFRESIIYTVAILIASLLFAVAGGWKIAVPILVLSTLIFVPRIILVSIRTQRLVDELKAKNAEDLTPNESKIRELANRYQNKWEGRVYRSSLSLLGYPLLDVQVSDVDGQQKPSERKTARGWIAIGDRAIGLLAIGGYARGLVAIGGIAVGGLSIGGLALGIVALGGLGVGFLGIGGLGIGILAMGGGAIGWQAAGGAALAWKCACGGAAMAYDAAMGGLAVAKLYAVGGSAIAQHANTEVAQQFIDGQVAKRMLDAIQHNHLLMTLGIVVLSSLGAIIYPMMYKRKLSETPSADPFEELKS